MPDSSRSQRLQSISKTGLILVVIALVFTVAGGWIAASRPVAAIDQAKLKSYRQSLQSYAAESLLLARQYKAKRPTAIYTEVSFNKLFVATSDVADALQTEPPEKHLGEAVRHSSDEASKLAGALAKLSKLPSGTQLDQLISSLTNIRQQLKESLEQS